MTDRSMGDITNSKFGDNANFQGDNISQTKIEQTRELQTALDGLKKEIEEKIHDEDDKLDADEQYEKLIKYIDENKPTKVRRCLDTLQGILGPTASIITIGAQLVSM